MAGASIHPCSLECIGTCRTSCLKMWIGSRLFADPERHCGAPTRSMGSLISLQNRQHPRNLESSRRKSEQRSEPPKVSATEARSATRPTIEFMQNTSTGFLPLIYRARKPTTAGVRFVADSESTQSHHGAIP